MLGELLAEAIVWIVFEVVVKGVLALLKGVYRGVRLLAHGVVVLVTYPLVVAGLLQRGDDGNTEADGPEP